MSMSCLFGKPYRRGLIGKRSQPSLEAGTSAPPWTSGGGRELEVESITNAGDFSNLPEVTNTVGTMFL